MARSLGCLVLLFLLAMAGLAVRDYVQEHPQDVPWTKLDIDDPVGRFTGRKLAALGEDPSQCKALLQAAGADFAPVATRTEGKQCGYADAVRLSGDGLALAPDGPVLSCPMAAAMVLFEREVLQPAAQRHFGRSVSALTNAGSYSCRRLYNRPEGAFSEHATANALDITGVVLSDGRRMSVLRDWSSSNRDGAFLREVRDGACALFATILSPDYNDAHADHLHLDQAKRGASGGRLCS
jgi:hypothetical protein